MIEESCCGVPREVVPNSPSRVLRVRSMVFSLDMNELQISGKEKTASCAWQKTSSRENETRSSRRKTSAEPTTDIPGKFVYKEFIKFKTSLSLSRNVLKRRRLLILRFRDLESGWEPIFLQRWTKPKINRLILLPLVSFQFDLDHLTPIIDL